MSSTSSVEYNPAKYLQEFRPILCDQSHYDAQIKEMVQKCFALYKEGKTQEERLLSFHPPAQESPIQLLKKEKEVTDGKTTISVIALSEQTKKICRKIEDLTDELVEFQRNCPKIFKSSNSNHLSKMETLCSEHVRLKAALVKALQVCTAPSGSNRSPSISAIKKPAPKEADLGIAEAANAYTSAVATHTTSTATLTTLAAHAYSSLVSTSADLAVAAAAKAQALASSFGSSAATSDSDVGYVSLND